MQIEFKTSNPPINLTTLQEFQQSWNFNLPLCYKEFLLRQNGGRPVQNIFSIAGFDDPLGVIQVFFGLNTPIKTSDLNWQLNNRITPFPRGLLEIACTDGDDLICIDTKSSDTPVYFYDHRPSWGNGIWRNEDLYYVASSFQEFLSQLKEKN